MRKRGRGREKGREESRESRASREREERGERGGERGDGSFALRTRAFSFLRQSPRLGFELVGGVSFLGLSPPTPLLLYDGWMDGWSWRARGDAEDNRGLAVRDDALRCQAGRVTSAFTTSTPK